MLTWSKGWGNQELVLDGQSVGYFQNGLLSTKTTVVLGDQQWVMQHFGNRASATPTTGGSGAYQAERHGILQKVWNIVAWEGNAYRLQTQPFTSRLDVSGPQGPLGVAKKAAIFTERMELDVPAEVPLSDQVFLLYLSHWIEKERAEREHQREPGLGGLGIGGNGGFDNPFGNNNGF